MDETLKLEVEVINTKETFIGEATLATEDVYQTSKYRWQHRNQDHQNQCNQKYSGAFYTIVEVNSLSRDVRNLKEIN